MICVFSSVSLSELLYAHMAAYHSFYFIMLLLVLFLAIFSLLLFQLNIDNNPQVQISSASTGIWSHL